MAGPGQYAGRHTGGCVVVIQMDCPVCREHLQIPEEFEGRSGRCNFCGSAIVVPLASEAADLSSAFNDGVASPYAAPRRPVRPGAGMVANEADYAGGAGASLGRIVFLGVLALIVTASVLPAVVIGFSAKTAPEEKPNRPRSIPAARGGGASTAQAPKVEVPPSPPAAEPVVPAPVDEKRIVVVGSDGGTYHKPDCRLAGAGARAMTLRKALDRDLKPCPACGG